MGDGQSNAPYFAGPSKRDILPDDDVNTILLMLPAKFRDQLARHMMARERLVAQKVLEGVVDGVQRSARQWRLE